MTIQQLQKEIEMSQKEKDELEDEKTQQELQQKAIEEHKDEED